MKSKSEMWSGGTLYELNSFFIPWKWHHVLKMSIGKNLSRSQGVKASLLTRSFGEFFFFFFLVKPTGPELYKEKYTNLYI